MSIRRKFLAVSGIGVIALVLFFSTTSRESGDAPDRRSGPELEHPPATASSERRKQPDHFSTVRALVPTDKNVADITRSLSSEELAAPSGLAALRRWLDVDAHAAAVWMSERAGRCTSDQARIVVHALLKAPEFFQEYCEQLPAGDWAQQFCRAAAGELSAINPEKAIELATRVDSDDERTELLRSIVSEWAKHNPEPAFGWLIEKKSDLLSDEQICVAIKGYATTDPIRALEWAVRLIRSDQLMDDTILAVFDNWVEKKPVEAARVVALLADDETRKGAVAVVAHTWMRSDPMTAYVWMKGLPEFDGLVAELPSD